jgi:HD-like signal output (HDOD) protein
MTPQQLVQEVSQLFTLPDVAIRLNELLAAPDSSPLEVVELVQLDPGLAATLLKLANSAYYGRASKVDTVTRAVAVIGERELQVMAMATAVTTAFKGLPTRLVDMASFWDNSVTCGVIARLLGRRCRIHGSEQLFLAGLLHAVGKLVFYARQPDEYYALLAAAEAVDDRSLADAERRVFGFDAASLGAELLKAWKLPAMLQVLVACQHRPGEAAEFAREAALLHVANGLAASLSPTVKGGPAGAPQSAAFDPAAWAALGLDEAVLPEILQEASLQAIEILSIINPGAAVIY